MEPTILDGDVVLGERMSVRNGSLSRGNIVCTKSPTTPKSLLCKRLTLLPHDELPRRADEFDSALFSNYPRRIPAGFCYIEGDNNAVSTDSKSFGPVPLGLITDRVFLRIWPPNRIGWL